MRKFGDPISARRTRHSHLGGRGSTEANRRRRQDDATTHFGVSSRHPLAALVCIEFSSSGALATRDLRSPGRSGDDVRRDGDSWRRGVGSFSPARDITIKFARAPATNIRGVSVKMVELSWARVSKRAKSYNFFFFFYDARFSSRSLSSRLKCEKHLFLMNNFYVTLRRF